MSQLSIENPLTQKQFNNKYNFQRVKSVMFIKAVKTESEWNVKTIFYSLFPIFVWLPQYKCKKDMLSDLTSGLTVAVMHIPQGMAYATMAHVNPIVGVYMAVFPPLVYVVMGTSRHISLGSFSITCIMAGRPIAQHSTSEENPSESATYSPVEVASVLCVAVGTFQVLLGCFKAGYLSVFMSKPIISGFTTGTAVLVFLSQLPHVFGIKIKQYFGVFNAIYSVSELTNKVSDTNVVALAMSLSVILCLVAYTEYINPWLKWKFQLPIELIVLIVGTLISFSFDLKTKYLLNVVGYIPTGFPPPNVPRMELALTPNFVLESIAIAIISFSVNISMASAFATKDHYKINSNQELFAYGFGNMFGGLFACLPMAASLSRSMIQYATGGKTQLVTIFSSLFLISIILFLAKFLGPLPYSVLAGIVIKSLKSMLWQVKDLPKFWRNSTADGVIWVITFLSVILLDIIFGLVIALILGMLSIILMNQKTYVCLLGRVPNTVLYLEMQRYETAKPIPGIMITQIYAGLHFANITVAVNRMEYFFNRRSMTEEVKVVILVFSAVSFVDPEALEALIVFIQDLNRKGAVACFAECTGRVYEQMKICRFFDNISEDSLFPSIHNAVVYYQEKIKQSSVNENIPTAD